MSFKYGIEKQKGSHMGMLIYYLPVSLLNEFLKTKTKVISTTSQK